MKAKAEADAAAELLDASRKVLESRRQLFNDGALARRQVDEAQAAYAQANSQFLSAKEHLRALNAVAKDEQIKAASAQVDAASSTRSLASSHSATSKPDANSGMVVELEAWLGLLPHWLAYLDL